MEETQPTSEHAFSSLSEARSAEDGCRIAFLVGEMVAGGQERQLCYLLETLDRRRYRPMLVVWNLRETDVNMARVRELGVPTVGYPVAMSSRRKLVEFVRLMRSVRPEIIHSCGFYTNFAAYCAARVAGAVPVGSIRNEVDASALKRSHPVLGRLSSAYPRYQISNSRAAEQVMMSGGLFKPGQVAVVLNGLDMTRFASHPVPVNPPHRILGIGWLVGFKRWDRLLEVGRELMNSGIPVTIQIAGAGPLRSALADQAAKDGIDDITSFLGYREDIPDLIAGSRVVVHTSDAEGTPNAIMEAMACGRPVVATNVGDVSHLIVDGETGFLVDSDDPAGLLQRLKTVLTDDDLAARMGRAARERAAMHFGLDRLRDQTLASYRAAGWKDVL